MKRHFDLHSGVGSFFYYLGNNISMGQLSHNNSEKNVEGKTYCAHTGRRTIGVEEAIDLSFGRQVGVLVRIN